ncbi:MAG: hypothetical protein ABIP89_12060 [Polyangiaceae bacterium]
MATVLAVSALGLGCNAIFGVNDYTVGDPDGSAGPGDGSSDVATDAVSCDNYDAASGMCFPCAPDPLNQATFLNECTGANCVPFDDSVRVPDFKGTLPVVPDIPPDSGSDGAG